MSTKIVVIKLKEVLKTALLAIIGILVLAIIVYLFIPKDNKTAYNEGTYSSDIILHNQPVSVEVTVSKNEILDIKLVNMKETQEVFYPLFERSIDDISAQIIENQSTDIEAKNSSMTSQILVKAVEQALEEAKK